MRSTIPRSRTPASWRRRLYVKNLVLYHTEDKNIARRQELYRAEGEQYFTGRLLIPEDMDVIEL